MELQLGLSLVTNSPDHANCNHKRTFSQIVEAAESSNRDAIMLPTTLSLLPSFTRINNQEEEEEEDPVVGWPPVNCRRKKKLRSSNNEHGVWNKFVKVKMEGVGIARKVDLTNHRSFHSLKDTLMDMFGIIQLTGGGDQQYYYSKSYNYELAYQDREGDWLLAQDVPWRNFIHCAQRLKLLKTTTGGSTQFPSTLTL